MKMFESLPNVRSSRNRWSVIPVRPLVAYTLTTFRDDGIRSVDLVLEAGIDSDVSTALQQYVDPDYDVQVQRGLRPPSMLARTRPVSARWTIDVGTRSTIHP